LNNGTGTLAAISMLMKLQKYQRVLFRGVVLAAFSRMGEANLPHYDNSISLLLLKGAPQLGSALDLQTYESKNSCVVGELHTNLIQEGGVGGSDSFDDIEALLYEKTWTADNRDFLGTLLDDKRPTTKFYRGALAAAESDKGELKNQSFFSIPLYLEFDTSFLMNSKLDPAAQDCGTHYLSSAERVATVISYLNVSSDDPVYLSPSGLGASLNSALHRLVENEATDNYANLKVELQVLQLGGSGEEFKAALKDSFPEVEILAGEHRANILCEGQQVKACETAYQNFVHYYLDSKSADSMKANPFTLRGSFRKNPIL
jgi:hypothetical protein